MYSCRLKRHAIIKLWIIRKYKWIKGNRLLFKKIITGIRRMEEVTRKWAASSKGKW